MKDRTLKIIFAVSLVVAIVYLCVTIYAIYPAFTHQIVLTNEDAAVKTGMHLGRMYFSNTSEITEKSISKEFIKDVHHMMHDYNLIKIKVFATSGETVFSTQQQEIGIINKEPYYHEVVAQGNPFTKMVKKDTKTLEGQRISADVVETYVPLMRNGKFAGAFELYHDITQRIQSLNKLVIYASLVPLVLMFVILTAMVTIMIRYSKKQKAIVNELKDYQDTLVRDHENLNRAFGQVENAKLEWERTIDCVSDIIIRTDKDGKITRFNKSLKEMTGKEYSEIGGCDWEDFIDDCNMEVTTLLDTSIELYQEPTGRWYVMNSYPFYDRQQNFAGNVITINNNTEIKKMSEELEETNKQLEIRRKKLRSALDEVTGLIKNVTKEKRFNVKFSNPNLMTCYKVKNCKKEDCICYGRENVRCWQEASTFCGGKVQGTYAKENGGCSKCEIYQEATSDPIYQIGEQFNNMMYVLEQKNIELEAAYKDLKETQSQMLQREKMASIGQLAAGVAHEINNPMGFISSNMHSLGKYTKKIVEFIHIQEQTVMSANSPELTKEIETHKKKLKIDFILEDIDQLLEESLDGADRVKKIVQNLKSFSRVDEAEHNFANINNCIESTLNMVWNELKYKATVTKEYGDIPMTMCYPQQLNQVFVNLLINASHAIEKQGEIRIKTWNGNDMVNISVSDTGRGIEKEKIERIFEPFFTTKPVGKGTGLGLSITYDIIKKHNGLITVDSEAGKGTTFNIKIPVIRSDKDE